MRGQVVHGEQIARHVDHFTQDPVARHVHAVIVTWREISGSEGTVAEQIRHQVVTCQQCFQAVVMAFRLQDFVVFDVTQLANHTICRHHQHVRIGINRADFIAQRAHEEFVEGAIAGGIWLLRLFHVDLVIFYEKVDDQFGQPARSFARAPARQASEPQFWQNVLKRKFKCV